MTRSAWVTVRLPGARTAPPTSTRIWFQTGAVKHGRKTASQDIEDRRHRWLGGGRFDAVSVIEPVESSSPRRARVPRANGRHRHDPRHRILASVIFAAMDDPIIQRIEGFRCSRGTLFAERRNRGYTLYGAQSGALVGTFAPHRIRRQVRSALLVALEGPMGLDRTVRDAPSCRSTTPYGSSPTRISSGS